MGELEEVPAGRPGEIVAKPASAQAPRRSHARLGIPAFRDQWRIGVRSDWCARDLRWATRKERVHDVQRAALDLRTRERPKIDPIDATWKRIDHLAACEHVRRARDQEAAWDRVGIDRALELKHQRRCVL